LYALWQVTQKFTSSRRPPCAASRWWELLQAADATSGRASANSVPPESTSALAVSGGVGWTVICAGGGEGQGGEVKRITVAADPGVGALLCTPKRVVSEGSNAFVVTPKLVLSGCTAERSSPRTQVYVPEDSVQAACAAAGNAAVGSELSACPPIEGSDVVL